MQCLEKVHSHDKRTNHQPRELNVPQDFLIMAEHITVPRVFMELFAVVCIETSHYVAFVKCGSGLDAPWCFFDSMADRKGETRISTHRRSGLCLWFCFHSSTGEQNGYNIPEVVSVPNLPLWLSEDGAKDLNERYLNDKSLPEHAKRLMCDAYMCMYQTDVMMYRWKWQPRAQTADDRWNQFHLKIYYSLLLITCKAVETMRVRIIYLTTIKYEKPWSNFRISNYLTIEFIKSF